MKVYREILGNISRQPEWHDMLHDFDIEYIFLDQWTAQKSRFLARGDKGNDYPVALTRHVQIKDGDIIAYLPREKQAAVFRLELSKVLEIEMKALLGKDMTTAIRTAVELGHAIGNQHWPAVVKGTKLYVPLTVDRKVMLSVMATHHIEEVTYDFKDATEVIPYLAPHEIRRLFGGVERESHARHHHHDE